MAKRPQGFSSFSPDWGELLFQTSFLAVSTSRFSDFSDRTYRLGSKQRVGAWGGGGGNHSPMG